MDLTERQFAYKTDTGAQKLLGILMVVLAPIAFAFSFIPSDTDRILIFGIPISGPAVPWIVRLFAILLAYFGVAMVKAAAKAKDRKKFVTLTTNGVAILDTPEIAYEDISQLSSEPYEFHPMLCLTHNGGKIGIPRSRMKQRDYDEMCRIIKERTKLDLA